MSLTQDDELNLLRRQVRELQEEIAEYRRGGAVGDGCATRFAPPRLWALTPRQTLILRLLCARHAATREAIAMAFDDDARGWEADKKTIDVMVCQMRPKLRPFGIDIQTVWGEGYSLPAEIRGKVLDACTHTPAIIAEASAAMSAAASVGPPVIPPADVRTMADRIRDVLQSADGPLTAAEVSDKLGLARHQRTMVSSQLAILVAEGRGVARTKVADPVRAQGVFAYTAAKWRS